MDRSYLSCRRAGNRVFSGFYGGAAKNDFDFFVFNARTARGDSSVCFPEPAGPMANTISFLANPSTSFNWFQLPGMIGLPVTLNTITFPVCSACGAFRFDNVNDDFFFQ